MRWRRCLQAQQTGWVYHTWYLLRGNLFVMERNFRCGGILNVKNFLCNLCSFVTKYVLLQYTLFCHKTCFGPVYTLSTWKRKDPKTLSVAEKMCDFLSDYCNVHTYAQSDIPMVANSSDDWITDWIISFMSIISCLAYKLCIFNLPNRQSLDN